MRGESRDVFGGGVMGVDQKVLRRPAIARDNLVDHRRGQPGVVAPIRHRDREDDALLGRDRNLGVVGGTATAPSGKRMCALAGR